MTKLILLCIATIAGLVPILWKWRQSRRKDKASKDVEKQKADLHKAIATGDTKRIAAIVDKLLHR